MPYCTQTDILELISLDKLIQLTDDANAGIVDASVVTRAIADADAEIDSYAAGRYTTLPFSPVPAMIRKVSVDLAIYNIYSHRKGVPDNWKQRYENVIKFLKSVASGEVTLGADDPEPPSGGNTPQISAGTRIFTRDKMGGF
jgi:phage gp36-like protein